MNEVTFILPKSKLDEHNMCIGQFYKIQLAYLDSAKKDSSGNFTADEQEVGYYSTVGMAKYTTKPDVSIEGLEVLKINKHLYHYTGTYL